MKSIRIVIRALRVMNVLLAVALLGFSWRYLLRPPRIDWLIGVDPSWAAPSPPAPPQPRPSEEALVTLSNPIRKPDGPPAPPPFAAVLKGALPAPSSGGGVAFLRSTAKQTETIARVGQPILHDGRPAAEYRGWLLTELGKDFAVFTNREGQRYVLEIDAVRSPAEETTRPSSRAGEAYRPEIYRSRRLAFTEGREVWGIDEGELDWAAQNSKLFLERDAQVSPSAGGGLRIDALSPGSMAAARGLMEGDVLREVNGRPLHSPADVQSLLSDPPTSPLRLRVDRAGKPVVLEYRPLPR